MFDRWTRRLIKQPLAPLAIGLNRLGISPNAVTWTGFVIGLGVLPTLAVQRYDLALICLVINRLFDGLDGELARRVGSSDYGGYLDIICDMIFYGAVVFGMALAQPQHALWSALLLFGFLGTSSSFLAYAALANESEIQAAEDSDPRSFYFLEGLAEGTETLLFFMAFLLWPQYYQPLAILFAGLCFATTFGRLFGVARRLKQLSVDRQDDKLIPIEKREKGNPHEAKSNI